MVLLLRKISEPPVPSEEWWLEGSEAEKDYDSLKALPNPSFMRRDWPAYSNFLLDELAYQSPTGVPSKTSLAFYL